MNTKEIPDNSPTPEQIESYICSGYPPSEASRAALRENQRAEKRAEKRAEERVEERAEERQGV